MLLIVEDWKGYLVCVVFLNEKVCGGGGGGWLELFFYCFGFGNVSFMEVNIVFIVKYVIYIFLRMDRWCVYYL